MKRRYIICLASALAMTVCFLDMARLGDWGVNFHRFLISYALAFGFYIVVWAQLSAYEKDSAAFGNVSSRRVFEIGRAHV